MYVPKIQPGDILSIYIGSLNPIASGFFNPYSSNTPTATESNNIANGNLPTAGLSNAAIPNYLVATDGSIEIPLIGKVIVADLTTVEAKDLIKEKVNKYLKEPTVSVRFMNYKISIMGEVGRPSVYVVPNERITLPEALSLAGDLTIYGKRENILVVRDVDGKKEFGRVDLTSREIYSSPYYYLHNNDLVYVEPNGGKIAQTDKIYQILPVLLSALSLLTVLIEYTRR